jgi:hypothetical protein
MELHRILRTRYWLLAAVILGVIAGRVAMASPGPSGWATGLNVGLLAATFVAIIWYCWETRQMVHGSKRQSDALVYLSVQSQMERVSDLLRVVKQFPDNWRGWTVEQRDQANDLSVELERVAFLASKGLVDPGLVMSSHAAVFNDSWKQLKSYIAEYRLQSGYPQREHFEEFALQCSAWLKKHGRRT